MFSWFRRSADLPAAARPMARELFTDLDALGLLPGLDRSAFEAALLAAFGADGLEELTEEWPGGHSSTGPAAQQVRQKVATRLAGVRSDWRFDPSDVLAQASARLPGRPALVGTREVRGDVVAGGRRVPELHVTITLGDGPAVHWRCSSMLGFMDAVNHAVARAGRSGQFIALATDGDYYAFVYADRTTRERLAASSLLPLARESDPLSGPLAADAA